MVYHCIKASYSSLQSAVLDPALPSSIHKLSTKLLLLLIRLWDPSATVLKTQGLVCRVQRLLDSRRPECT